MTKDTIVTRLRDDLVPGYQLPSNERLLSLRRPNSTTHNKEGIVGIFTVPPTSLLSEREIITTPTSYNRHYPPTHRLAIILHGTGGHKNYCYHTLLATELASKLGYHVFRFDFRGNGDSQEVPDVTQGRSVKSEVDDVEWIYDVFKNGGHFTEIGINLIPNVIVGHSRGSTVMFQWAIRQQVKCESGEPFQFVPSLVNCSGRYRSKLVIDEYHLEDGGAQSDDDEDEDDTSFSMSQYRFGKFTEVPLVKNELLDLAKQDFSGVRRLDPEIQVFSIYGLHDTIVPVDDSSFYANALGGRHELVFIHTADHNFYGTETIDEENSSELNPDHLPLTKRRKVNFNYQVKDLITDWLHTRSDVQRYKSATHEVYYYPRWRGIEGISNFRDIGGWRTEDNKHYVKAAVIFRCANPSNVTPRGIRQLKTLGIRAFFDLRSNEELENAGSLHVDGIEVFNTPVYKNTDMSPQGIARRYKHLLGSWYTFKYVYEEMLKQGGDAFRAVLMYLRDHPGDAIAYNCTAGKDRTGLMTMLILLLLGVDDHTIAKEYELTTVGLLPDHPGLKKGFMTMIAKLKKDLETEGHDDDNLKHAMWELSPDQMFENMISSKYETMISTIQMFNLKFGGIEQYCKEKLRLTQQDLDTIRKNLWAKSTPYPDQNAKWHHRSSMGSLL